MDNPNNQQPQRQSRDRNSQSQQPQNRNQQSRRQPQQSQRRQRGDRQQQAARQSVRADAERQQQARKQASQRQAAREQQQAAHRQEMREQTMREHQERMQAQRQQQGAAAYSTSNYTARNSRRSSRRTAADDIRAAAQGNYVQQQRIQTPQGNRIGGGSKGGSRRPGSHRRRNIIIAVVAAVILIIGIPGVAFGVSAMGAKDQANTLMTQGKNLVAQIKAGDMNGARATANDLSDTADKLHQTTEGPLWTAATNLPIFGSDIKQVRALADVADTLSGQVLVPIVDGLPEGGMSAILVNGSINVQVLQSVLVPLGASSNTIHQCASKMENLGDTHLDQLKQPVATVKSALGTLDRVSEHATELSNVLPGMLGTAGSRTYLLVACSGAEIRSTGGFPGSAGIMTVDNGHIEVGDFSSPAARVPNLTDENKIIVPAEEERIFGKRVTESFFDTTFIPNFPRAAQLMKDIWEKYPATNPGLDGIICVDPVFLQRVLALTGGITTADGTVVDGTNAAEMLMNTVYLKYEDNNEAQDALFSQVAAHAMSQVFGNISSIGILEFANLLVDSFDDRRIYVWMNNPNEENVLEDMNWANAVSKSEIAPETGVYVGCAIGAKIDWYLDIDTEIGKPVKNADGSVSYEVKVKLKNTLTDDAAEDMPWYVPGMDEVKRTYADMPLDVYLYAPKGGTITNMQTNGYFTGTDYYNGEWNTMPGEDPMTRAEYDGHEVWFGMTQILGGTETLLTYTVTTSPAAKEDLRVVVTPLPNEKLM